MLRFHLPYGVPIEHQQVPSYVTQFFSFALLFRRLIWATNVIGTEKERQWRVLASSTYILSLSCRRIMRHFSFLTESVLNLANDHFQMIFVHNSFISLFFLKRWCNAVLYVGMPRILNFKKAKEKTPIS
jgi:hypothetical protein